MRIHYVSGSRADFGLMRRTLEAIHASRRHSIEVIVTGQHTNKQYGATAREVYESGLAIAREIAVELAGTSGAEMAVALAVELKGFVEFWAEDRPDLVLLLGDRGEMLAAALAAIHLGIHVGHIGGGERSGTLDEGFRHAISKLSHYHFPTTQQAADRLIRMGENAANITVIGAPGLVDIGQRRDREWLDRTFGIAPSEKAALVVFHPVVQQADQAAAQVRALLDAVDQTEYAMIIMRPNSDAGGAAIDATIRDYTKHKAAIVRAHLAREEYMKVMASVDLFIGNSSSGIIETASFGIPFVNVGGRQAGREQNANTFNCLEVELESIVSSIKKAEKSDICKGNIYGDGRSDIRMLNAIDCIRFDDDVLNKLNTY